MRMPLLLWTVLAACPSLCQFDHLSLSKVLRSGPSTQGTVTMRPPASVSASIRHGSCYFGSGAWTQGPVRETQHRLGKDSIHDLPKAVRNTIYAGVGGFGPPFSLNYERSWGAGKKAWGVAAGGSFMSVSQGSRAPMSSIHNWQVQVNRMPVSRAGFEYGAGFIYSSGVGASEEDTGYPQRLFLGVKPACLRIQFNPRGVMVRLYGIGLITLHEFNAEWRKKIEERDDPRVFGSAWKFPLSALWALEVGYTF